MGRNANPARAQGIIAAERKIKSLELRKLGYSYSEIGQALGISKQTAFNDVTRELAAIKAKIAESAEDLKTLECMRLDSMMKQALMKANGGDLKAIDRVIKIMIRRANLVGLDAPKKTAITDKEGSDLLTGAGLASLLRAGEQIERDDD